MMGFILDHRPALGYHLEFDAVAAMLTLANHLFVLKVYCNFYFRLRCLQTYDTKEAASLGIHQNKVSAQQHADCGNA